MKNKIQALIDSWTIAEGQCAKNLSATPRDRELQTELSTIRRFLADLKGLLK